MDITKFETNIEFINSENEAFAGIAQNENFQWAKIVVCDDRPNANGHQIEESEFDNLVRTGINTPIKMTPGDISDGHYEAMGYPIGVITNLIKENKQVKALAAFWKRERPDDVALLKQMWQDGNLPQVSWEITYENEDYSEDGKTRKLRGTSLDGLCIVKRPAYAGRTPIIAFAEEQNSNSEATNVEDNKELETKVAELESKVSELTIELETVKAEKNALAEFKNGIEAELAKQEKLAQIKERFTSAGINKDDNYFATNSEKLLALSEEALDFLVQEMVAFAEQAKPAEQAIASKTEIPNIISERTDLTPKEIASNLREFLGKKQ